MNIKIIVAVGIGGATGTLFRHFVNISVLDFYFPIATVVENIFGSLLLGFLTGWFIYKIPKDWLKAGLGVGVCGGFTTMSTFASDSFFLSQNSSILSSIFYIVLSLFGGILAAVVGFALGESYGKQAIGKKRGKET